MGQSGKLRGLGLRDPGSNPGSPIGYPQELGSGDLSGETEFLVPTTLVPFPKEVVTCQEEPRFLIRLDSPVIVFRIKAKS